MTTSFKTAVDSLVTGFWNAVKPGVTDLVYGESANPEADSAAVAGIQQLTGESHGKQNQLNAQLPFKKRIQSDLSQALGSRPGSSPTLSR